MSLVIGVSGSIGTGKTTFASALASALRGIHASFGDYIRGEAMRRGMGDSREVLQRVGEEQIQSLGYEAFVMRILTCSGWNGTGHLVLEGVRHLGAVEALRAAVRPHRFLLVFLALRDDVRAQRIAARAALRPHAAAMEMHSTEQDVPLLSEVADVVLDAELPAPRLVVLLKQRLKSLGAVIDP